MGSPKKHGGLSYKTNVDRALDLAGAQLQGNVWYHEIIGPEFELGIGKRKASPTLTR